MNTLVQSEGNGQKYALGQHTFNQKYSIDFK